MTTFRIAPEPERQPRAESRPDRQTHHVVMTRAGTWALSLPVDYSEAPPGELSKTLTQALLQDPRVVECRNSTDLNIVDGIFTLFGPGSTRRALLTGSDAYRSVQLQTPIAFTIKVPKKNQPVHMGRPDMPSEDYRVLWDGRVALVTWQQESDKIPFSSGQVAAEIIRDACSSLGFGFEAQSCDPRCDFLFLHTTLVWRKQTEIEDLVITPGGWPGEAFAYFSNVSESPWDNIYHLYFRLSQELTTLATAKNYARRAIDIEFQLRSDVADILLEFSESVGIKAKGQLSSRCRKIFHRKNWRPAALRDIAEAWLMLSNIETLRRQTMESYDELDSLAEDYWLLEQDLQVERRSVESLDVSLTMDSLNKVFESISSRSAATATLWGALGGGIVGGIATLLGSTLGS